MIKYNNNTIYDWNFDASNIIKVYRNNAIVFYKVSGESPTPVQEPCFAVVDDISQYSDTEFEDAFNKADGKWYKLNNLNQYEQYGIYDVGSSLSDFTYYEGKLVATGTTEYQRSGGTWVVVGTYEDTSVTYEIDDTNPSPYVGQELATTFKVPYADVEAIGFADLIINDNNGSLDIRLTTDGWTEYTYSDSSESYEGTVTNDGEYFYLSLPSEAPQSIIIQYIDYYNPTPIHLIFGSKQVSVEYDEIQDPPDNLVFSSMSDALEYECPWWGMSADIDNTDYMFCEGNEWLTKYTYIEVSGDYLCDNGNKYKKMQEYDRIPDGTTTATTTYVKGDLIESASTDCSTDYSTHYLTFVAQTDNVTFSYSTATSSNKLQYSIDGGSTWVNLGNNQSTSSINNGEKIMFKASGLTVNTERGIGKIIPSASASVEGNIMSLEYGDNFSGQTTIQNNYQFRKLFSGVTTITSAENMVLPATTVKQQCYSQMFQGCTNLVKTPKTIGSSAMTWSGNYCFSNMFSYCTSLTTVPSGLLPALNLGTQCYWYMFEGCSGLTTAPDLLATTTASQCYNGMFSGCISLNYIKVMSSNGFNMNEWVKNVASNGIFVKSSTATFSSCGQNTYPCNWTVQNA